MPPTDLCPLSEASPAALLVARKAASSSGRARTERYIHAGTAIDVHRILVETAGIVDARVEEPRLLDVHPLHARQATLGLEPLEDTDPAM